MSIDSVVAGLEHRTRWTEMTPSQPGWYWFKGKINDLLDEWTEVEQQIVCVNEGETVSMVGWDYPFEMDKLRGQWWGPIETPR